MRNQDLWYPTKYVYSKGRLRGSRNARHLNVGSRLASDLVAKCYDESIGRYVTGDIVDLGCGEVPLFSAYQRYGRKIICADWYASGRKNAYTDVACNLNQLLPFKDEIFNTIIISSVLEHIEQPYRLWLEMNRILSKDGKILLNVPFFHCLHEMPYDYYRYTEFALKFFAENCGFRILLLKATGGAPEIIGDILAKHFAVVPLVGSILANSIQTLTYAVVNTRLGSTISGKTKKIFPMGYFMVAEKKLGRYELPRSSIEDRLYHR